MATKYIEIDIHIDACKWEFVSKLFHSDKSGKQNGINRFCSSLFVGRLAEATRTERRSLVKLILIRRLIVNQPPPSGFIQHPSLRSYGPVTLKIADLTLLLQFGGKLWLCGIFPVSKAYNTAVKFCLEIIRLISLVYSILFATSSFIIKITKDINLFLYCYR